MANYTKHPVIHHQVLQELPDKLKRYHIQPREIIDYAYRHDITLGITTIHKIYYEIDHTSTASQTRVLAIVDGILAERRKTLCDIAVWKI